MSLGRNKADSHDKIHTVCSPSIRNKAVCRQFSNKGYPLLRQNLTSQKSDFARTHCKMMMSFNFSQSDWKSKGFVRFGSARQKEPRNHNDVCSNRSFWFQTLVYKRLRNPSKKSCLDSISSKESKYCPDKCYSWIRFHWADWTFCNFLCPPKTAQTYFAE